MEGAIDTPRIPDAPIQPPKCLDEAKAVPFAQQWEWITKQERIELDWRASYWQAQHDRLKIKYEKLEEEIKFLTAKNKDLQHRLFGKKSEKRSSPPSEKGDSPTLSKRPRGQVPGSPGHGRTQRPDLPVIIDEIDFPGGGSPCCAHCGLPDQRKQALDEYSELIEVHVQAHVRRYRRPSYVPNPSCQCEDRPAVITAPLPPKLIPRSPYDTSFWLEIILGKFRYGQPTQRHLQDLSDQGLPVSPGTVVGGLKTIAPVFKPVLEALYRKQMTEELFHNDETRWEVFVEIEGKVGHRWYLWVTRSESVIYYLVDPSRSTDVPGAHFAGLCSDRVIIVCDRYSAYKKLARLSDVILLAFCWAHVRRDYLDAGRSFTELESWALRWKGKIALLYHHNTLRLEHWDETCTRGEQPPEFQHHHEILNETLQSMHREATRLAVQDVDEPSASDAENRHDNAGKPLSKSARQKQREVCQSLLNHWHGLTVFMDNPHVPLDNNLAENTLRGPVTGRKNYYGSGSIWSAQLAATLFSILQTLVLCGINPRHWLNAYLNACAENGGKAPQEIAPFLPWCMDETRRAQLSAPLSIASASNAALTPMASAPASEPTTPPLDTS
jgi:transposase